MAIFAIGQDGVKKSYLLRSYNNGLNWDKILISEPAFNHNTTPKNLAKLSTFDGQNIIAAYSEFYTYDTNTSDIYRKIHYSNDSGSTWNTVDIGFLITASELNQATAEQRIPSEVGIRCTAVNHFSALEAVICYSFRWNAQIQGNLVIKTLDGGITWSKIYTDIGANKYSFWAIHFLNNGVGYAIMDTFGQQWQRLSRTTSGGLIWIDPIAPPQNIFGGTKIVSVAQCDEYHAFISPVGLSKLKLTTNNGVTWSADVPIIVDPASTLLSADIYEHAVNKKYLFASNSNGLYRSEFDTSLNTFSAFILVDSIPGIPKFSNSVLLGYINSFQIRISTNSGGTFSQSYEDQTLTRGIQDLVFDENTCDLEITSIDTEDAIGINNGTATVNATASCGTLEYRVGNGAWQLSNEFSLPASTYTFSVRCQSNVNCNASEFATIEQLQDLQANAVPTNVTINGGSDGKITVNVTSGSGNYTLTWPDTSITNLNSGNNPQQAQKTGFTAGIYNVSVIDNITLQEAILQVSILEPNVPLPASDFLFVPQIQSLRFVPNITEDGCTNFNTFDNVLFCKEKYYALPSKNYFQRVAQCDNFKLQIQSNYETHTCELRNYKTDALVTTFPVELKVENIGKEFQYNIIIKNHGGGQSRVYFTTPFLPIKVKSGDVFYIQDNADGFNGGYEIVSVNTDLILASQYLVINKNYGIVPPQSNGVGLFIVNIVDFNVYEAAFDFNLIPNGYYYSKIKAFTGLNVQEWVSEPIRVSDINNDTNVITFTNGDSAFDINYSTEIVHKIRVESRLFKRNPASQEQVLRNTNGSLVKLSAKPRRKFLFEFFMIPPYMHEKLSVVFNHDLVTVNTVEIQTDEAYKEPDYIVRYPLSNSSIVVEQVTWFKDYNGDDLGSVDLDGGLIVANDGFIKY